MKIKRSQNPNKTFRIREANFPELISGIVIFIKIILIMLLQNLPELALKILKPTTAKPILHEDTFLIDLTSIDELNPAAQTRVGPSSLTATNVTTALD